jgi:hypothetical protein
MFYEWKRVESLWPLCEKGLGGTITDMSNIVAGCPSNMGIRKKAMVTKCIGFIQKD